MCFEEITVLINIREETVQLLIFQSQSATPQEEKKKRKKTTTTTHNGTAFHAPMLIFPAMYQGLKEK